MFSSMIWDRGQSRLDYTGERDTCGSASRRRNFTPSGGGTTAMMDEHEGRGLTEFLDDPLEYRRLFSEVWGRSCWCWSPLVPARSAHSPTVAG
jgi:hypothetical protein